MDRRTYIEGLGTVAVTGALAGCAGNGNGVDDGDGDGGTDDTNGDGDDTEYGLLSTSITDQPNDIDHFESLVVTIDGIWVKPDGADEEADEDATSENDDETDGEASDPDSDDETETDGETDDQNDDSDDADDSNEDDEPEGDEMEDVDESAGRYYIEFEEPQEADLVGLQGAETQLIDETELAVGEYQFLQLDIAETNGVLTDGGEADVETPGNAPLQFKHAFDIRSEERTQFIADFAPFQIGRGQRYRIRPVATGTQVLYGEKEYDGGDDEGDDEGDADEADASDTTENEDRPDNSDGGPDTDE